MVIGLNRPLKSFTSNVRPSRKELLLNDKVMDLEYHWILECDPIVKCEQNEAAEEIQGLFGQDITNSLCANC